MMENVCDSRIDTHLVQMVNKSSTRNSANSPAKYVRRQGKSAGGLQSYLANGVARYFKRLKLDYPTTETTRASRRFVRNMKRLSVSLPGCPMVQCVMADFYSIGYYPSYESFPSAIPGPVAEDFRL
jgi:ribosomal protein L44E